MLGSKRAYSYYYSMSVSVCVCVCVRQVYLVLKKFMGFVMLIVPIHDCYAPLFFCSDYSQEYMQCSVTHKSEYPLPTLDTPMTYFCYY